MFVAPVDKNKIFYMSDDDKCNTIIRLINELVDNDFHPWHITRECADLSLKFFNHIRKFTSIPTPLLWPMDETSFHFTWDLPLSKLYVAIYVEGIKDTEPPDGSFPHVGIMEMSNNPNNMLDERCKQIDYPESLWDDFETRINKPKFQRVNSVST